MRPNVAATLLTAALGFGLAFPVANSQRQAFLAADIGDVVPGKPVRLAGNVRLDRNVGVTRDGAWVCDALCAALLATPGIESVTLAGTDRDGAAATPVTFRLVARSAVPANGLAPLSPEDIVDHIPDQSGTTRAVLDQAARESARNAIVAEWALRLATDKTLVRETAGADSHLVIVLHEGRKTGDARVAVSKVEIRDGSGAVLLRRQRVTAEPVAVPFYLGPQGAMGELGLEIGRSFLHTGPRYAEFKPIETLFLDTTLERPKGIEGGVEQVRERISAALDPGSASGDLALVPSWISTLDWRRLSGVDIDLLARLIPDARVTAIDGLYDGYAKYVSPRLRTPIVIRLNDPATLPRLRSTLDRLVGAMPAGTFRTLTSEEKALLSNPQRRLESSALVERLADGGAASVPMLIEILQEDVGVEPWAKRWREMESLCRALTRLGPDAAAALPIVERLFDIEPRNPLANDWGEAQAWRVAMVRMGKPVDALRFPSAIGPDELAQDRENVRRMAQRAADPALR